MPSACAAGNKTSRRSYPALLRGCPRLEDTLSKTERLLFSCLSLAALLGMPVGIVVGLMVSPLATALTALAAIVYGCFLVWGIRIRRRIEVRAYHNALLEERRCREADLARHCVERARLFQFIRETSPDAIEAWCDLPES